MHLAIKNKITITKLNSLQTQSMQHSENAQLHALGIRTKSRAS